MQSIVLSCCLAGIIVGTALAELKVQMHINATLCCEAHKKCETLMASFTTWLPKGET
ncbi:hypothetical protein AAVH_20185, partial [Aphelenchoides avenae]